MSITCPFNTAHPSVLADQARRLADALDRIAADTQPSPADLVDAPIIDCWKPATRFAPALIGVVSGHPILAPSRAAVTSEVFAIDPGGRWARTWSRYYRLADPIPSGRGRWQ